MSRCAICDDVGLVRVVDAAGKWVSRPCECQVAEREARRKLAVAGRRTGDIDCRGMHHGEQVTCLYATPARAAEAAKPVQLALIA